MEQPPFLLAWIIGLDWGLPLAAEVSQWAHEAVSLIPLTKALGSAKYTSA